MSMVSPEYYIEEITKDKTYKELIKIREEFIASFESFEEEYVFNPDANWETNFCPSPEVSVVNGRFCPQSVRSFCPIVAGFNAGTYKVPACVL